MLWFLQKKTARNTNLWIQDPAGCQNQQEAPSIQDAELIKTIYQTPGKWKSIWTISGHLYFIHSELWASDVAHSTSFPALLGVQDTASLCLFSHCHPKNANSQRLIASVSQCFLLCQSVLIMNSCVNESSILTDLPARHKQVNHLKAFPRWMQCHSLCQ